VYDRLKTWLPLPRLSVRLLVLVGLALAPALGLVLYTGFELRGRMTREAQQDALRAALALASEQNLLVEGARQLLIGLSNLPEVWARAADACSARFAAILSELPQYANLTAVAPNGDLFCAAIPSVGSLAVADRPAFRPAIETGQFSISGYAMGGVQEKHLLLFSLPLLDEAGRPHGVVTAALDLSWLGQRLAEANVPQESVILVIDQGGVILARHPGFREWVGKQAPDAALVQPILAHSRGTVETAGLDGVQRLYGFAPIRGGPRGAAAYVAVGIPTTIAYAEVNRIIVRDAFALGLAMALALILGGVVAAGLVVRPARRLMIVASRVAAGDLSARSGLGYGGGAMGEVALAFDRMAGALEAERAKRARRQREAEILAQVARSINASLDLDTVLRLIGEAAKDLSASDLAGIAIREPGSETMRYRYRTAGAPQAWDFVPLTPGKGLEEVLAGGRPVRIATSAGDSRTTAPFAAVRDDGILAAMAVPIRINNRMEGLIFVASRSPRAFTDDDEALLMRLGDHVGTALENARLFSREQAARAEAEAARERIEAIQSVTDAALARLHLDGLLNELLERIRSAVAGDCAIVFLLTEERTHLTVRASLGFEEDVRPGTVVPIGEGIAARIASGAEPIVVEDLSRAEVVIPSLSQRIHSLIGAPLVIDGRVIGLIEVVTLGRREFTQDDARLLKLVADRVASAIDRARLLEQMLTALSQSESLSRRLIETQETERRSIARELHDQIGQDLTALKLLIQMSLRDGPEARERDLDEARQLIDELLGRIRDLSLDLRPTMLDDLGLLPTLQWYLGRYTARTGVRVKLEDAGPDGRLPPSIETTTFRVVQEALTNVARHAHVNEAVVRLERSQDRLVARIEDHGVGFDPVAALVASGSSGLSGMRERAILLGGRVTIQSQPGGGTLVTLDLPFSEPIGESAGQSAG
jgi:signal transduction histidine kinase